MEVNSKLYAINLKIYMKIGIVSKTLATRLQILSANKKIATNKL